MLPASRIVHLLAVGLACAAVVCAVIGVMSPKWFTVTVNVPGTGEIMTDAGPFISCVSTLKWPSFNQTTCTIHYGTEMKAWRYATHALASISLIKMAGSAWKMLTNLNKSIHIVVPILLILAGILNIAATAVFVTNLKLVGDAYKKKMAMFGVNIPDGKASWGFIIYIIGLLDCFTSAVLCILTRVLFKPTTSAAEEHHEDTELQEKSSYKLVHSENPDVETKT